MESIVKSLDDHIKDDEKGFGTIHQALSMIKENHLAHIEQSMAKQATDIGWLKQFFWLIASASVGSLVVALMNLILQ